MKKLIFAACTVVVIVLAIVALATSSNRVKAEKPQIPGQQQRAATSDKMSNIDGAVNPELIPDEVAFTMMFRVIGNRQTQEEKDSIRSYLRQAGLGCQTCQLPNSQKKQQQPTTAEEPDIDAVVSLADEFWQRVSVLDEQVKQIKDRTWPNPSQEVMSQLQQLEAQKQSIVAEIVASIPTRLSADAVAKLQNHIDTKVKPNVKIFPDFPLPGGTGWEHGEPNQVR